MHHNAPPGHRVQCLNAVSELFIPKNNISTAMLNMWDFLANSFSLKIASSHFHVGQIVTIFITMHFKTLGKH